MNKEEARKRLEEIKQEQEKLQAIIDAPDRWQDKLVQPEKEKYFFIRNNSGIGLIVESWAESDRKPEHAFRTAEQAELIKEKMLLMQEMHAFAHVRNGGWLPDWEDEDEYKWGFTFSGKDGVYADWQIIVNEFAFGIAVKSEEIAKEMFEIFGERTKAVYNIQY